MNLCEFDYHLPAKLIADRPPENRDGSRLLVLYSQTGFIEHRSFVDLPNFLKQGDLLVINNSKVFPAKLIGRKLITNGRVEILLEKEINPGLWHAVGKNLKENSRIRFENSKLEAIVIKKENNIFTIRFNQSGNLFFKEIEKIGLMPIPPYIEHKRKSLSTEEYHKLESLDKERYQTAYAKELGSIAAPTAGLHFNKKIFEKIQERGVDVAEITLHVGLGTFLPVKEDVIETHKMHQELYSVSHDVFQKIIEAKKENRRVIAVGTTTTRVLEDLYSKYLDNPANIKLDSSTDIFIYPGYKFKCVDGLITNFHLPKSTLLILASAFAGRDEIMKAYDEAINHNYRFYSYGDAMLIV